MKLGRKPRGTVAGFARYLRVERGASPETIRSYVREARTLEHIPLTEASVREWMARGEHSHALTRRRLAAAKAWCRYTGALDVTRMIGRPSAPPGIPRPIRDFDKVISQIPEPARTIAIFLSETGLRISEAKALRAPIPAPTEIHIRGKGGHERVIPLTQKAQWALNQLVGRGCPMDVRLFRRALPDGITPHRFRHHFATTRIAAGADLGAVQKLLGHASSVTTQTYAYYALARLRAAVEMTSEES